ncbi:MAG: hypothetical protein HC768_20840 [Acaryochloris sp. CRU_2_0]|nr:hypothetical protein [Acaryochloris sp. CRU_2_0]
MVAEQLIPQIEDFESFLARFNSEIDPPPSGVVGFKSIVCYRTGLDVQPVTFEVAASRFYEIKQHLTNQPLRLIDKPLIDFCCNKHY